MVCIFLPQVLVKNDDETVCGGAILNEDFVLTSAACVKHMQFSTVVLGEFLQFPFLNVLKINY